MSKTSGYWKVTALGKAVKAGLLKIMFPMFFALSLLFCGSASASSPHEILAVTENWPPYNYETHTGIEGKSTDIVIQSLERSGLNFKVKVYPWARAYKLALTRKNVLIFTIARTGQREGKFKWLHEIQPPDLTYLYRRKGRESIKPENLKQALKFKIGAVRESYTAQALSRVGLEEENLQLLNDAMQGLRLMSRDRIDLLAQGRSNIPNWVQQSNLPGFDVEPVILLNVNKLYAAFSSHTDDAIVRQVALAMKDVMAEPKNNQHLSP